MNKFLVCYDDNVKIVEAEYIEDAIEDALGTWQASIVYAQKLDSYALEELQDKAYAK